ncbi:MAG TPA: ATP-binding cassette domain-containing protein, partial [Clostridia bacterium]|nr:ATP-binding cassette domain-containing protein [Clostridia bacterium]
MCPQICAEGLSKTYTVRKSNGSALRGFFRPEKHVVSFNIGQGELVGYIGPNGAGKSTTVKVLSGILRPDGGQCTALGMVPWKDRQRYVARIGVVFGQRTQLWWDLPVRDSFLLLRDIYRVSRE